MTRHTLTRAEIQQLTVLGIHEKIQHLSQELVRLREILRAMTARRGRPPAADLIEATQVLARATRDHKPPRARKVISVAHRRAISRAQKARWRKAKAGKVAS